MANPPSQRRERSPSNVVRPKNLTQQLVDTLGLRIVSGVYPEGERLTSEPDLLAEFDVSRPILREVTKVLMAKGLVISRTRVGTVVRPREDWSMLDADVLRWVVASLPEQDFIDTLFEVRMVYEPGAAAMAARNAKPVDLARISAAFDAMARAETPADLLDPDLEFHQAIMDATHNPLLSYIGRTLHTALAASMQLTNRHPEVLDLALPRHKAIHDAVIAGDEAGAIQAVTTLLKQTLADFDEVIQASLVAGT